MNNITFVILMIGLSFSYAVNGQSNNKYEKIWSSTDRLTESDFQLDIESSDSNPCFAQFSMNYSVTGLDFMTKNFNKKVENIMYMNASWLNKNATDKQNFIRFQQILFDLSEVYARKFRKQLLVNRKKITQGIQIVEEINSQITKELTEERAQFQNESNGGRKIEVYDQWEKKIESELNALMEFRHENSKKIKIEK
ncbi:hypothetical protein [Labilibacter marinus]|uniref:hypothetical protein n=1 Tax=Labilibacter marinus TaxID=1477105 RepID=UPI0008302D38|nr:hypothetical protein [Labilibacter marinus]